MRSVVWEYVTILRSAVGKGAPYLLIEIVLPGGTLIAFLLFLYQRRRHGGALATADGPTHAVARWFGDVCSRISLAFSTWHFATGPGSRERDGLEAIGVFGALPAR